MKLEDQVCSLKLAKKLKELGVEQESFFYWCFDEDKNEWDIGQELTDKQKELFNGHSAFTVAELGEMIKPVYLNHIYKNQEEVWYFDDDRSDNRIDRCHSKREVDTRAKVLVLKKAK